MSWKSRSIQKFNEDLIRKQKIIVPREIKRIGLVIDNNRKSDYFDVHQIRKEWLIFGIERPMSSLWSLWKNKTQRQDIFGLANRIFHSLERLSTQI